MLRQSREANTLRDISSLIGESVSTHLLKAEVKKDLIKSLSKLQEQGYVTVNAEKFSEITAEFLNLVLIRRGVLCHVVADERVYLTYWSQETREKLL